MRRVIIGNIFVTLFIIVEIYADSFYDKYVISQKQWKALPQIYQIPKLNWPIRNVIVITENTDYCKSEESCSEIIRNIQKNHMEKNLSDIGYNFLIAGNIYLFNGRGWRYEGQHTFNWNSKSISIVLLGLNQQYISLNKQLRVMKYLLNYGVQNKILDKKYKIYYQPQILKTADNNSNVKQQLKFFPNFDRYFINDKEKVNFNNKTDELDQEYFEPISREKWHAIEPRGKLSKILYPVKFLIISHLSEQYCLEKLDCEKEINQIQRNDMKLLGKMDIGHNFLIGGDGLVYSGRGWNFVGDHTTGWNEISFGITFINSFHDIAPFDFLIEAINKLIINGIKIGKIKEDYIVLSDQQFHENPQTNNSLYQLIKKWKNWRDLDDINTNDDRESSIETETDDELHFVHQQQWSTINKNNINKIDLNSPVKYVIIVYEKQSEDIEIDYKKQIQRMQETAIFNNLTDINHNFLLDNNGNIYYGRGWNVQCQYHEKFNDKSLFIHFFETFHKNDEYFKIQMKNLKKLIDIGLANNEIIDNYIIFDSRQLYEKEEDINDEFFNHIQGWSHWESLNLTTENIIFNNQNFINETINHYKLNYIPREEWGALNSSAHFEKLDLPVNIIVISQTDTPTCYNKNDCKLKMKKIQKLDINVKNWADIGYNFIIGGDGAVYEGRGWDNFVGHLFNWSHKGLNIGLLGNFDDKAPSSKKLRTVQRLIEHGIKIGKINNNYNIVCERQISHTVSHGNKFYEIVKTWIHWNSKLDDKWKSV